MYLFINRIPSFEPMWLTLRVTVKMSRVYQILGKIHPFQTQPAAEKGVLFSPVKATVSALGSLDSRRDGLCLEGGDSEGKTS